jgi:hypothetical protein
MNLKKTRRIRLVRGSLYLFRVPYMPKWQNGGLKMDKRTNLKTKKKVAGESITVKQVLTGRA